MRVAKLVEGRPQLLVERPVLHLGPEPGGDLGQPLGQRLGRVDPEDAVGVSVPVAIDILDRELRLADAAHPGQPGRANADGLLLAEDRVELFEVFGAADEVEVPGEWHEERGFSPPGSVASFALTPADSLTDTPGDIREGPSRFFHVVTGLPPLGKAWSFPNGADCQESTGRKMTGITRAVPSS